MYDDQCKKLQFILNRKHKYLNFQGTLEVRGWMPTMKKLPPLLLKNGDYKVEISYHKDGEIVYGLRYYASVINIHF